MEKLKSKWTENEPYETFQNGSRLKGGKQQRCAKLAHDKLDFSSQDSLTSVNILEHVHYLYIKVTISVSKLLRG